MPTRAILFCQIREEKEEQRKKRLNCLSYFGSKYIHHSHHYQFCRNDTTKFDNFIKHCVAVMCAPHANNVSDGFNGELNYTNSLDFRLLVIGRVW